MAAITATGRGPGEFSGPAVALTIDLDNRTGSAVSLASTVVNLSYGRQETPGSAVGGAPSRPFSGTVGAGRTASAVYVFSVPPTERRLVTIQVSYSATRPVLQFTGSAA